MTTQHGGSLNWFLGGAVGGIVGALLLGGLLWVVDPEIVTDTIPAVYGLQTGPTVGWLFHFLLGLGLGVIFAFLVTRRLIIGIITADVETPFLAAMGPVSRITLAGIAYGLTIWVFLPGIIATVLLASGEDPFPTVTVASLVGHLLYGMLLGLLVSLFVDIAPKAERSEAPFEEASDTPQEQ